MGPSQTAPAGQGRHAWFVCLESESSKYCVELQSSGVFQFPFTHVVLPVFGDLPVSQIVHSF